MFALSISILAGGFLWICLMEEISLIGITLGALVVLSGWALAVRVAGSTPEISFSRLPSALARLGVYLLLSLKAAFVSAWRTGIAILRPGSSRPGIVALRLRDTTPERLFLLSYGLTLSPGEQVIEIDEANHTIYLHLLHTPNPEAVQESTLKQYDHYIKEILP